MRRTETSRQDVGKRGDEERRDKREWWKTKERMEGGVGEQFMK